MGPERAAALLLAGLAGCTAIFGLPEDLADCGDADCRQRWLTEHWEADPERVAAEVGRIVEPAEQVAVAQALAEKYPGKTGKVCEVLPDGPARERCGTLNQRPHLWQIDTRKPEEGPMGSRSVFRSLAPTGALASPWDRIEPLPAPCESQASNSACQSEGAWRAAMQGRTLDAARHCMAIEPGQWRFECFFQAAERTWDPGQPGRLGGALQLCMGGGIYLTRCLGHLSNSVAEMAPPAGGDDTEGWRRLNRLAAEARQAFAPVDPPLGDRFVHKTWALAMARAYSAATPANGNPIDTVEPSAIPHVRAAAALRLFALEGDQDRGATDWQRRLDEALTARTAEAQPPPTFQVSDGARDLWTTDLEGEADLLQVAYVADARRGLSTEPATDGLICILEAAARDGRPHDRLFSEALDHPDRMVRWTAARLLPVVGAAGELTEKARRDADPLVRGRAGVGR